MAGTRGRVPDPMLDRRKLFVWCAVAQRFEQVSLRLRVPWPQGLKVCPLPGSAGRAIGFGLGFTQRFKLRTAIPATRLYPHRAVILSGQVSPGIAQTAMGVGWRLPAPGDFVIQNFDERSTAFRSL